MYVAKPYEGVSTSQHLFYFRDLVFTDLTSVFLLIAQPILTVADNILDRPSLCCCPWLAHSPSLTRLAPTCKPNSNLRFIISYATTDKHTLLRALRLKLFGKAQQ